MHTNSSEFWFFMRVQLNSAIELSNNKFSSQGAEEGIDPMNFKITFNTTDRHMADTIMVSCESYAALKTRRMGETIDD